MQLLLASLSLGFPCAVVAQADPRCEPVVLTTVLASDGTPLPGVPVHAIRRGEFGGPTVVGGWLRAVDDRLGRLRSRPVFSDPEGRVELLLPNGRTDSYYVFAGAPFAGSLAMTGEPRELGVVRLEQFTVEVVDGDGTPLPYFAVALHADRRDREVALSNAQGVAVFGLPASFEARLTVAPAGWIGVRDGMPTVAKNLRRQRARLVVPPFGTVRVRATVDGEPRPVKIHHAVLAQPERTTGVNVSSAGEVLGIEFGPVALGQDVRGEVRGNGAQAAFSGKGPCRADEVVVFDVDLTPVPAQPQPQGQPAERRQVARQLPVGFPPPVAVPRPLPQLEAPRQGELSLRLLHVPAGAEHSLGCRFYDAGGGQVANSMLHWQRNGDTWQLRHPVPAGRVSVAVVLNNVEVLRIDEVEVPVDGATKDDRLAGIDLVAVVRRTAARVRVVDQDGIPILGARFEIRNGPMSVAGAATDQAGYAVLKPVPATTVPVIVRADGMRSRELRALFDGAVVEMRCEPWLTIELAGLPADLPRERLAILLRHVARDRLDASVHAPLGAGDCVRLPMPVDGRYRVLLIVTGPDNGPNAWSGSTIDECGEQVVVGDEVPGAVRYPLDATAVARLRKALADK